MIGERRAGGRRARLLVRLAPFALALLLGTAGAVRAQVPVRSEQFIYTVVDFNGRDYGATFVRQPSRVVYLIANRDNFLQARETFVYFWPITGNYRLDTGTIDRQFTGKLVVQGNGISRTLSTERYTYYNLRGEYELNWKVAKGAAAERVYRDYQRLAKSYEDSVFAYREARGAYEQKLNELAARINRLRSEGGDPAALVEELRGMREPTVPVAPNLYAVPPVSPQEAFVVNLPAGRYRLRFVNPNGTIMQGSEKELIVFTAQGRESVGYDVIPADKWTRPESSVQPGSVLYVNGSTDLYLRPFYEAQYNDLYHQKLLSNDARGNSNMTTWVKLQQVPNAKILLRSGDTRKVLEQEAFAVEQLPGASLGYRIVPWAEAQRGSGSKPDLIAYHLAIRPAAPLIRLSALDESGKATVGGQREIRVVSPDGTQLPLLLIVFLPLVVAAVVAGVRARRYAD